MYFIPNPGRVILYDKGHTMTDKQKKAEMRKLRKKAIKVQNNLFPRKVSMAEAMILAQRTDDA